jgi:hypothetical protein
VAADPSPVSIVRSYKQDRQAFVWSHESATTSSAWEYFGGFGYVPIVNRGPFTVMIDAEVEGVDIEVRLLAERQRIVPDSVARRLSGVREWVTFSFAAPGRPRSRCRHLQPLFRSIEGGTTVVHQYVVKVDYRQGTPLDDGICE